MNVNGTLNMNGTVNTNYLSLSLLPFAADEIKRVEQMLTKGEDKLKAVLSHVEGVYESTSGPAAFGIQFADLKPQMEKVIAGLVKVYQAEGLFTKQEKLAA